MAVPVSAEQLCWDTADFPPSSWQSHSITESGSQLQILELFLELSLTEFVPSLSQLSSSWRTADFS